MFEAENKKMVYGTFGSLTIFAMVWLIWNYLHPHSEFTVCIIKNITGIPCPSCGVTSSIFEIANLNFANAFEANPLGYVVGLSLVILPPLYLYDLIRKKNHFYSLYIWVERKIQNNRYISLPLILLVILNWIYILGLL